MLCKARSARSALVALLAVLVLAFMPVLALAADKDYSLEKTQIFATVHTDGTLTVHEDRTLDLDGHFHGFYWEIDTTGGELGDCSVEVLEAGEISSNDSLVPYTFAKGGTAENTWTMKETSKYTRVDVHYDKTDGHPTFYIRYKIKGALARWSDTGELYWKFVGSRWEKPSNDVYCYLYFEGATEGTELVAGENIRGWLHNASLQGQIDVPSGTVPASWDKIEPGQPGTIRAWVPKVRKGDFAEIRSTFPAEWLSGLDDRGAARLDTILTEEDGWARAANQRFENAVFWTNIKKWVLNILIALNVVGIIAGLIAYRRSHDATFDDKYFRDVPTNDHPAVLYFVDKNKAGEGPDFTASLMRLSDMGVIKLEKATYYRKRLARSPKEEEDWRIVLVPEKAEALTDPIDKETLAFVFDYVGENARKLSDGNERPENTVLMSDFKRVASKLEESYTKRLDQWKDAVKG
ncbi:MAG: DUF2207 domain-containing protein [Atopobiaceae bacterium]|nr:DUF2207 domain-containing protein [Atopobiaceae bacterium]